MNEEMNTASVPSTSTQFPLGTPPMSGNSWKVFKVTPDVFRRFETGRNAFERWSKHLDLSDVNQKEIYDYAKKNRKNTIVLQCGDTGCLRSIRRRAVNEGSQQKI